MNKIIKKANQISAYIKNVLSTRKGRLYTMVGGGALAAVIISAVVIGNWSNTATAATGSFKVGANTSGFSSVSSELASSSSSAASSVSALSSAASSAASMVNGLPIISAAPAPSGAAPTAAQAAQTIPVTSVDFNRHSLTLSVGDTSQLTTSVTPGNASDKTLTWTSTNNGVATVDQSGNIKAVGAGTASIRATNPDGQRDTCTVTVPGSSGGTGGAANNGGNTGNTTGATGENTGNAGGGSGSGIPAAQYVRVDTTRIYTDEITGIAQTVRFQGIGFANEVAGGYADINTTSAMGAAHFGLATVSLTGTNGIHQGGSTAGIAKTGQNGTFTFDNLSAGTYTLQLTAHDGTVVARYHFTIDSSGNVQ